jgi:hypothetical protein
MHKRIRSWSPCCFRRLNFRSQYGDAVKYPALMLPCGGRQDNQPASIRVGRALSSPGRDPTAQLVRGAAGETRLDMLVWDRVAATCARSCTCHENRGSRLSASFPLVAEALRAGVRRMCRINAAFHPEGRTWRDGCASNWIDPSVHVAVEQSPKSCKKRNRHCTRPRPGADIHMMPSSMSKSVQYCKPIAAG